ncbi:hypothetical protein [Fluoribacter gormanii]|uniref:hypothetical protein n=1 Tax=Fluoribacter gormanii TaxID=464 RepID=UPI001040EEA1|nr:hypothetical protein [Fluoribacter gormanii]
MQEKIEPVHPLYTKILKNGVEISVNIKITESEPGQFYLSILEDEQSIGTAIFHLERGETLYIDKMSNLDQTRYKHVGTALHEILFKKSCELGLGGHVEFDAAWNSHMFHYINGFRALPSYRFIKGASWNTVPFKRALEELIELGLPDSCADHDKLKQIEKSLLETFEEEDLEDYEDIKKDYAEKAKIDVEKVTFSQLMFNVFFKYDYENGLLQKLLAKKKPGQNIDTSELTSLIMYLPNQSILAKKRMYGILPPEQVDATTSEKIEPELGKVIPENNSAIPEQLLVQNKIAPVNEIAIQFIPEHHDDILEQSLVENKTLTVNKIATQEASIAFEENVVTTAKIDEASNEKEVLENSTSNGEKECEKSVPTVKKSPVSNYFSGKDYNKCLRLIVELSSRLYPFILGKLECSGEETMAVKHFMEALTFKRLISEKERKLLLNGKSFELINQYLQENERMIEDCLASPVKSVSDLVDAINQSINSVDFFIDILQNIKQNLPRENKSFWNFLAPPQLADQQKALDHLVLLLKGDSNEPLSEKEKSILSKTNLGSSIKTFLNDFGKYLARDLGYQDTVISLATLNERLAASNLKCA